MCNIKGSVCLARKFRVKRIVSRLQSRLTMSIEAPIVKDSRRKEAKHANGGHFLAETSNVNFFSASPFFPSIFAEPKSSFDSSVFLGWIFSKNFCIVLLVFVVEKGNKFCLFPKLWTLEKIGNGKRFEPLSPPSFSHLCTNPCDVLVAQNKRQF